MYFLAGFLTENREGGELGDVRVWRSLSPPPPPAAPPEEETSCRLRCKSRGGCLVASLALGVGAAGKWAPRRALTYLSET